MRQQANTSQLDDRRTMLHVAESQSNSKDEGWASTDISFWLNIKVLK